MGDLTDKAATPPSKKRKGPGRWMQDLMVLSGSQLLSKAFGFIAFAWLARQLTLEEYGALETAVGMAAIGAVALELGTGSAGVRRLSQKEGNEAEILGAVIAIRSALAVVVAPLLAFTYVALTKSHGYDALYWLFALSLISIPFNHAWFFQAQEKMFIAGFGQTLKMGVFLIGIYLLAPKSMGVISTAYAELIAAGAMAAWFAVPAFGVLKTLRLRASFIAAGRLFRESAILGVSSFVNALAQYLPVLIVATLVDDRETAMFGASQRLVLSIATFSFIYFFNLYPTIARLLAQDVAALDRLMSASGRVASWVGVATCGALSAMAPMIMRLVFGDAFEGAASEFAVLVWIGASMLALGNAKWLLTAGQRQASLLSAHVATVIVVLALSFIFVPKLGGVGAAIACNLGFLAQWAVAHYRTRGMPVRPRLADSTPAFIAAMIIIIILTGLKPPPLTALGAVVAVVVIGVALDRKTFSSLNTLVQAKSPAN